jgi:hypothetical protein
VNAPPAAAAPPRLIAVIAADDALVRAVAEHLRPADGWSVRQAGPGAPPPGALLLAEQEGAIVLTPLFETGGSDQQLRLPMRLSNLLTRIREQFDPPRPNHTVGPFLFEPGAGMLTHELTGAAVRLTELERDILLRLIRAEGAVVDRDTLLSDVWGYSSEAATHTVETHVWRLRQKLGEDGDELLVTDEAGGYRLAE